MFQLDASITLFVTALFQVQSTNMRTYISENYNVTDVGHQMTSSCCGPNRFHLCPTSVA